MQRTVLLVEDSNLGQFQFVSEQDVQNPGYTSAYNGFLNVRRFDFFTH
jgi:hypothetical protein